MHTGFDIDLAARRCVAQGVVDQIVQQDGQLLRVGGDQDGLFGHCAEIDLSFVCACTERADRGAHQIGKVHGVASQCRRFRGQP